MTFVELQEKWSHVRAGVEGDIEKVYELLASTDEGQVRSTFDLLLSLDECALCEVLHEVDGQLRVREDVVLHHCGLWEKCILEEIIREGNLWHGLGEAGGFRLLTIHVLGDIVWGELSESQQQKVVQASLRSVEVPSGTFMMGALPDDECAYAGEKPRHEVILHRNISVCVYPCTQGLYESVMGHKSRMVQNRSYSIGSMRPVDQVSWCDAVLFCNKLSEREGLEPFYILPEPFSNDKEWSKQVKWNIASNGYRLLTEAEWEYCARGGEEHLYAGSDNIDEVAWYKENSGNETQPVGKKKANGFGLYDMSGNVFEWVFDTYHTYDTYHDPLTPGTHDNSVLNRIYRGGSWKHDPTTVRVSIRYGNVPLGHNKTLGFRFGRTLLPVS